MPGGNFNNKRHSQGSNKSQDKKRRRENEANWKSTRGDAPTDARWGAQVVSNQRFEAFYKAQGFVKDDEWSDFMGALGKPLPACFRINTDYAFSAQLKEQLLSFVGQTAVIDGVAIEAVQQMPWYPSAYKLGTDRKSIRKLPGLEGLHKWMMQHTDSGNITRQEAVSMVPPLALNVSPHHKCLDMCAAPGSKTSQLLEIINRSLSDPEDMQGIVVANDSDTDRAYMLVHQCRRINSPLLLVTTHKGQMFPKIACSGDKKNKDGYFDRVLCDVPCSGDGTLRKNPAIWAKWGCSSALSLHPLQLIIAQRGVQLLKTGGLMVYSTCSMSPYEDEAVIAELLRQFKGQLELVDAREFVPVFKARPGLSDWYVIDDHMAIKKEVHTRKEVNKKAKVEQKARDAVTAATAIVADAGVVAVAVASDESSSSVAANVEVTVEVTPVDDVVHMVQSAIEEEKKIPLGDDERDIYTSPVVSDPLLADCINMGMQYFPDNASVPKHLDRKIRKSFFPPTAEEKSWMHLERCLRCVPHDEDTGGFFVATLRKIEKPGTTSTASAKVDITVEDPVLAAIDEAAAAAAEGGVEKGEGGVAGGGGGVGGSGNSKLPSSKGLVDFKIFNTVHFNKIKDYYGFNEHVPEESMFVREDSMAAKNGNSYHSAKSVYYIPKAVRDFMNGDKDERLKVVTAGIKVLERMPPPKGKGNSQVNSNDYRLVQDGIQCLVPHITSRKVTVSIQDFCNLLDGGLVSLSTLAPDTLACMQSMSSGAVICLYKYHPRDVLVKTDSRDPSVECSESSSLEIDPSENAKMEATDANEAEVELKVDVDVDVGETNERGHAFFLICWRGVTRTINVMCGKTEMDSIKHQLEALNVLRPKIKAIRREEYDAYRPPEENVDYLDGATATVEIEAENDVYSDDDA